ncbi:heat-inducible transcriptional repressor HrcA [[Clostridium] colinum]|uniref:heat-inducible transcriptional repressor HrcA n=1 Tax=[Clostridium] colinum TaxID=36835 RepID=UPI002023E4B7|nr:heat-inducible transcriptional repressor HrcA [[Clostridium] colinum]
MRLNDRKIKILEALITDYIETGEPIGSRTIAKKYDLGISSATIRNELSDLEDLGLVIQPHASSGRIPSDKGYRLYVDTLMEHRDLSKEEVDFLKDIVVNNINHMDYLMEQTARALSTLTNYATVISKPKVEQEEIKHIQLVPLDESSIIAIVITKNKNVKNYIIPVDKEFFVQDLLSIASTINNIINEFSLDEIKNQINKDKQNIISEGEQIIVKVFEQIFKDDNEEKIKFYTSGINNILDFKEFSNIEKAKPIFQSLEEKDMLINILSGNNENNNSIQILIGGENSVEEFKDCSIVKTEYKIAGATGTIGIIAPTRMDYAKTISLLDEIVKNINNVLKTLSSD